MHWMATHFINSMQGLLGGSSQEDGSRATHCIADIRQAMLDCLGSAGCLAFPMIERRVLFASDLQGLWYLRGDMMAALSAMQGESIARQKIQQLTDMFQGLLPRGMFSRPSPLGY